MTSLIADRMREQLRIGSPYATFRYAITANDVERFSLATGDHSGPWAAPEPYVSGRLAAGTPTPPSYYLALDPFERGDLDVESSIADIPWVSTGGGNAVNEVVYQRPLRVGDDIAVEVTFTAVYEKEGRSGRLLFRERVNRYRDASGALVAESTCTHVRTYDVTRRAA